MTSETHILGSGIDKKSESYIRALKKKWATDKTAHVEPNRYEVIAPTVETELASMASTEFYYGLANKSGNGEIATFDDDEDDKLSDVGFGVLETLFTEDSPSLVDILEDPMIHIEDIPDLQEPDLDLIKIMETEDPLQDPGFGIGQEDAFEFGELTESEMKEIASQMGMANDAERDEIMESVFGLSHDQYISEYLETLISEEDI